MLTPRRSRLAHLLLDIYGTLYPRVCRLRPGQEAAFRTKLLRDYLTPGDRHDDWLRICRSLGSLWLPRAPVQVGGVNLPQPFILAGGWIKGRGYDSEIQALAHVIRHESFLPGWRTLPLLAGPVEFGSFNRWPHRPPDAANHQAGFGNPGIRAATAFLSLHQSQLPATYGINISPPPVPGDAEEMRQEITESLETIFASGLKPSWITLNLAHIMKPPEWVSPVHDLLQAASQAMPTTTPLWFKVSPGMTASCYHELLDLCVACNVKAIIATDVLFQTDSRGLPANVSGRALAPLARQAQVALATLKRIHGHAVDLVACGGILAGRDLPVLTQLGIQAWQYHSALLYRGPVAGPLIWWEAERRIQAAGKYSANGGKQGSSLSHLLPW